MPEKNIVRISYDNPEQAANMANMLDQSYHPETGVRAVHDGRTVTLVFDNPILFDIADFANNTILRITQLLKRTASVFMPAPKVS